MPGERFSVRLVPEDGGSSDRVMAEVGMDGFNILSSDGTRTLRKYPLHMISRWSMRGSSLILFTRSQVDVEDRSVTLQGDEHTIRSVLDTLTSCCMQMAELLQSGQGGGDRAAANSLSALLKKSKKTAELPTADQVEFWRSPEKTGWMHSQGEHIKTWRKRWFVLKQGFLFRFASEDVSSTTKPRGIVDLSQVTDVTDGTSTTGRPNSIKLSTATGSRCYLTESETSQVEWISALESSVERIVKIVAGVDEEDHSPGNEVSKALAAQFKSYSGGKTSPSPAAMGAGSSGSGYSGSQGQHRSSHHYNSQGTNGNANQMLNVVNYYGGGGGDGGDISAAPSAPHHHSQGPSGDFGYVNIDYGGMSGGGFQVAPPEAGGSGSGGGYSSAGGGAAAAAGGGMYGNVYAPPANTAPSYPPQQHGGGIDYSIGYGASAPPQNRMQEHQQFYQHQGLVAMPPPQQQEQHQYFPPAQEQQQQYQQYHQQQQQQPQHQQQHGATLLDAVTAPAAPPSAPSQAASPWQVHYTADNRPYYFNVETQITQWEAPAGA
ncbi:hypothetical protein Ndes2526B_g02640 [Nannochloris sp. 'desiccata']|nr:hypothetical protein KSW81_007067 [Chlorella desiccata (nom. nud.)]KAH7621823.1 putative Pleckstrin homology domain-containing protein 1 [Chlorella desiccata (nom. nud.)]